MPSCLSARIIFLPLRYFDTPPRSSLCSFVSLSTISVLLALLPKRQVISNANPQVEIALYKQGEGYAINLVNVSGHHGTAFFAPVPMYDLEIRARLPAAVTQARSLQLDRDLTLWQEDDYTCLNLDRLDLWDGIRLT